MQLRKRTLSAPPPSSKRRTAATIAPADAAPQPLQLPPAAPDVPVPAPPPPSTAAAVGTIAPVRRRPAQILFVKLLNGKTITLRFEASDTVLAFKERLSPLANAAPESMRLIFAGRQLEDAKVLSDYNIQIESTVYMVLRLCGD